MKGLSLRYKLLASLTVIPLCGLLVFLWVAISTFSSDKIAYVFDSSLWISKTRAARVNSEVSSVISLSQALVLTYRADTKNLAETGTYYFDREAKFLAFQVYAVNEQTGGYERTVDMSKTQVKPAVGARAQVFDALVKKARTGGIVLEGTDLSPGSLLMAARFGDANDPKHVVAVTLFEASELAAVFGESGTDTSYLVRKSDSQPLFAAGEIAQGWGAAQIWSMLAEQKTPEGISELISPAETSFLASFSDVGVADLVVISMVDKNSALSARETLVRRSQFLFVAILALLTIASAFASRGLTLAFRELNAVAQKFAEGQFDVRVDIKSGGEVGVLASNFNLMAEEVSRRMNQTGRTGQANEFLLPENHARLGTVEVVGHRQPADRGGGDWWYYFEKEDKAYIWVGDGTGRGDQAALLSSAVRAVASVIHFGPHVPVSISLAVLNRAIYETFKGQLTMSFFLACIDKTTGEMTYANASHQPPMILHKSEELAKQTDFVPVAAVGAQRLGEKIDGEFEESRFQLKPDDRIVFYTDGVVHLRGPEGTNWGEQGFLASVANAFHAKDRIDEALGGIVGDIQEFRGGTPLEDDATLILIHFEPEIASVRPIGEAA